MVDVTKIIWIWRQNMFLYLHWNLGRVWCSGNLWHSNPSELTIQGETLGGDTPDHSYFISHHSQPTCSTRFTLLGSDCLFSDCCVEPIEVNLLCLFI